MTQEGVREDSPMERRRGAGWGGEREGSRTSGRNIFVQRIHRSVFNSRSKFSDGTIAGGARAKAR